MHSPQGGDTHYWHLSLHSSLKIVENLANRVIDSPTGPSWETVCMLKDISFSGSLWSSFLMANALAIILLFLILLGSSSLRPMILTWEHKGWLGTGWSHTQLCCCHASNHGYRQDQQKNRLSLALAYLHHVRFQMRMVALVHTQVLIAIPVPNMENKLIFSTMRLGRFLIVHSGIGLLVCEAIVTLASHLWKMWWDD